MPAKLTAFALSGGIVGMIGGLWWFFIGQALPEMQAKLVVRIRRDVVKLVHGDQVIIEGLHAIGIDCEAERRVGADQHLSVALQKCTEALDLAAVVITGRVT